MERRRARLEVLAQVASHDYGLSLRYGDAASQEGDTIHIEDPVRTLSRLGGGLEEERVLRYQKGMTLIEVAHRREGTLKWVARAVLESQERPGFFQIWHALEDARCENRLGESLPGTRKNFRAFIRPALEEAERQLAAGQLPRFLEVQWGLYLRGVGLEPGEASPGPGALRTGWFDPDVAAFLRQAAPAIGAACRAGDARDAFGRAGEIYEAVRSFLTEEDMAQAAAELSASGIPEEILKKVQEMGAKGEQDEAVELKTQQLPSESVETEGEPLDLTPEELAKLGHWASPWFELKGHKKEVHPTAALPDERTIVIPPEGKAEEYRAVVQNAGSQIKVLAWKLMQIIHERTYTRYSGSHRSGRLNAPKLWKQRLGRYRLFQRRESPERLDVCFTLLVDESGSMNRESKYLAAREATIFLAEVLARLKIPFEIIGYSTESSEAAMAAALGHIPAFKYRHMRHSPLQHRVYKAFDEDFLPIKHRMVNIYPRFNNWDEEHILFAYRRLLYRPEREKIIIITSDGQPNGDASHLIETVNRLEKLGIRVVGVGVVDPFVEQIYPNHIVVRHLPQLSEELVRILRRELLGGAREGRAW
ncbi:MAG: hypothetical protein HYR52_05895 [Candidatus Tectomicrobia bacterium]|nr:hypothetical protein [Candidatus Tectomicrobia bacterium]